MKPRLLDLFCGAGGCAVGYHRAGFEVVGVDIAPQPHYPFEFEQHDALSYMDWFCGDEPDVDLGCCTGHRRFDAIHASPPCQHYSQATAWRGNRDDHPDLIAPTRELLERAGLPYVIENVEDARGKLLDPVMICGDDVDLPIYRRRYFETNWPLSAPSLALRHEHRHQFDHGGTTTEAAYREAMGCEWMTVVEARQAIPPAYTELIGHQLMQYLQADAEASRTRPLTEGMVT